MKSPPIPRPRIFDIYWRFAAERQRVFERRVAGEPGPWTDDLILRTYKFCNVFHAADRVSQFLIREVAYYEEPSTPEDRLFQIVAFRTFSNIQTWCSVRASLSHTPTLADLRDGSFEKALDAAKRVNSGLYTGAFILCANKAYGFDQKHRNHVALFQDMFLKQELGARLLTAPSLAAVFALLRGFPLIGDFMAYQIAIDLNYSDLINFSENDFTKPGPGALRGLKKVFTSLGDHSPAEAILWMVERQQLEFGRLSLDFHGLWGRPIQAIDAQGLFCETDKYCRVAVPELASARKRIKARFTATTEPIAYFFPPKWGITRSLRRSVGDF